MGLLELAALPVLVALTLLAVGALVAVVPARALRALGDGFGFDGAAAASRASGRVPARVAGVLLAGYGLFLMANTVGLFRAFKF
ncbi:hypothetical protein ABH931_001017 [Streptacidiphilus sp. MAP12-33]|uniref:hypothetical protein n=1 Tax=Streptacidiphilus sp. MAP12-33 TaxID=3156266 RepID=UPI0035150D09